MRNLILGLILILGCQSKTPEPRKTPELPRSNAQEEEVRPQTINTETILLYDMQLRRDVTVVDVEFGGKKYRIFRSYSGGGQMQVFDLGETAK